MAIAEPGNPELRSSRGPWLRETFDQRLQAATQGRYQPLAWVAVAMCLGIAADRFGSIGLWWWLVAGLCLLVWWGMHWRRFAGIGVMLLLACAATAGAWHHANWRLFSVDDVGRRAASASQPVCLEAIAADAPRRQGATPPDPLRAIPQGEKTELSLRAVRIRDGEHWRTASGRIELVVDGHLLAVRTGDRLRIFGQLRAGGVPLNPGQFDFAARSQADRCLSRIRCQSPDCVQTIAAAQGVSLWRWITDVRTEIENRLRRQLGPQRAPLAAAMLVGARRSVDRQRAEAFRRTGTLHVLVVSGLHVGLVVSTIYLVGRIGWFPRRTTLVVVMLLIFAYALLTGARPPVVRAAVLAEMMCLAAIAGRPVLAINSLAAASILVLALSPADLFLSGAQLSFIAAATLIWFAGRNLNTRERDPMERLLRSVRPWPARVAHSLGRWAWLVLLATFVVWLTTAPLLLCRFNLLSPVALPISVVVFPLVTLVVVSSLLLVIADAVAPFASDPIAGCCRYGIDWLEGVVQLASNQMFGPVWSAGPAIWWTVGAYALLATGLLLAGGPKFKKRLTMLGLGWLTIGFIAAAAGESRSGSLRCSFIAVGHGCSVLVQTPGGANLLYDAGSLGSPDAAAETIAGVLWSKGVMQIDALVLSHADVDHINAAPGLMERFAVGGVHVSAAMFADVEGPDDWSAPAELLRRIRSLGVPINQLGQGDRLAIGQVTCEVLHPFEAGFGPDNARSLVLAIEFQGRRVLLPGDLESPGMDELLTQAPYDCDLLLAPHHGSARSDPPGFAAWSSPEWVVVSGGSGDYSRAAGATYSRSGAQVLRTVERGMVEFSLDRDSVNATCFLK